MQILGKIVIIVKDLLYFLIGLISSLIDFMINHIIGTLIVLVILGGLLFILKLTAPKRLQRKQERQTARVYKKTARQTQRVMNRNMHDLANTCYRVIEMLNERIRVEDDDTNLVYVRDQYNIMWNQLKNNQPVTNTPEDLLELYLQVNNDNSSPLYEMMQTLNSQYWETMSR